MKLLKKLFIAALPIIIIGIFTLVGCSPAVSTTTSTTTVTVSLTSTNHTVVASSGPPIVTTTTPPITSTTTISSQLTPSPSTDQEKKEITEAVLNNPDISTILQGETYRIEIGWLAITGFNPATQQPIKLILKEDGTPVEGSFPVNNVKPIVVYPLLLIHIGNPETEQLRVAVDRETKQIILIDRLVVGDFTPVFTNPMLKVEVNTTMAGTYDYMGITDLGFGTYMTESGLRFPHPGSEATRTVETGQLSKDALSSLTDLFQIPLLSNESNFNADTTAIDTDARCVISFNYGSMNETIKANYNPFRHDFLSLPDVPSAIKDIFLRLKYIAETNDWQKTERLIAIPGNLN